VSPQTIRHTILGVLRQTKPYMVPQPQLLREVNLLVRPAITLGELVKHLSWLKAQEMITFEADSMEPKNPDARKWMIREAGEAALNR
jgi:hypothetical protein